MALCTSIHPCVLFAVAWQRLVKQALFKWADSTYMQPQALAACEELVMQPLLQSKRAGLYCARSINAHL